MCTNVFPSDIAYGIDTERIMSCLEDAWASCLLKGSKVLALTIPETQAKPQKLLARRKEINDAIMKHDTHNL